MDETYESIMATLVRIEKQQQQFYESMMRTIEIINSNISRK
jgi:hypothetical protein